MRNEMAMYALKPVISLPDTLHNSKPMYEMRNIHKERSRDDHTEAENKIVPDITEQCPLPEYNLLEARQEKILAQLADLKKQVSTLCNILKRTNQTTVETAAVEICNESQDAAVSVNLIVNVNPKMLPYSALALKRVWTDTDIRIQTYIHSSIDEQVPSIEQSVTQSPRKNVINIQLIWKDVADLELVSGLRGYSITGEMNFLRHLSRLVSLHNYENSACPENVNRIDWILDLCHSIRYQSTLERKQELILLLVDKLNINSPDKKEPDIADIAVWSTIKQVYPKCPSKLQKWFIACEKRFYQ
ncbi:putative aminoacyl tRNA synthase complex-interacting multifunctional protein 2 isoform X2 [Lasioglossum baleicum]|uniref:putative aminoacyl tRNA synthase complex-interacting multifunctional protein 2 isoform X2 n=1 Tax=Lasioglossum baleicum TaxID=434251 RepID=UPI003FCD6E81